MAIKFTDIWEMIVPQFALIALFSPLSAYLVINNSFPKLDFISVILSFMFAIFGFNIMNMIYDSKLDSIDKPLRSIPAHKTTTVEALLLSAGFYFLSFIIGVSVSFNTLLFLVIFLIFTLLYTSPIAYAKKYWWASSFFGVVLYGIVPFFLALSVSPNKTIPYEFLFFFAGLFFFVSNVKDFEDIIAEKQSGINSLPILIWEELATLIILAGEFILIILMGLLAYTGFIKFNYAYAAIISIIFYFIFNGWLLKDLKKVGYKNIVFNELHNKDVLNIITQSDAVTFGVMLVLLIQITFGITSII